MGHRPLRPGHLPVTVALAAILSLAPAARHAPTIEVPQTVAEASQAPNEEIAALAPAEAEPAPVEIASAPDSEGEDFWMPARLGWEPRAVIGSAPASFELLTAYALEEPAILGAAPPEEGPRLAQIVPLPVPRPPEFRRIDSGFALRRAERQALRRQAAAATPSPAQVEDTRNFFEKLFGVEKPATPALAYAALDNSAADAAARRRVVPPPAPVIDSATAIYDISARSVVLPNGERLEAHSGLGDHMDDPRFVHVRMRGATPPGTYDLTEREALFHGVRAIRLTPLGGSEAVHNRVGLLAHTYMLGPNGASNGCVSFRDYDRFLQAYLRGEIRRLVVVAGVKQASPPLLALR
ncbi:DUF2778 domain-containing protein [Methylobacterium dankookense]|uniref:Tlde1 domain-containing protein n=1 Tax=Methylobacterium dankookense TaxID=560405 RepID=A0A564FX38_9HYPH|nr:DUF2778 domain-containing protein [Methylobacterium dankookense]GJD54963.1 hypothetical protein IFDJLNFL_0844 [Methylobacterium dankookense]VUF11961.1 hypothetical protein MTDSW087_01648 [Methylobacterium dankookense]